MGGRGTRETKSAGGVVAGGLGKILVVSQRGTSWSLPKGHIDPGEDALTAAKREIYEEAGIEDLEFIKELGSYQRYKIGKNGGEDKSELKTIIMFLFKTKEEHLSPIDPHNPEARWVEKEKVADLLTHPRDQEFFLRVKNKV
jgi:8-oxo-dGTP diphosphatase